MKPFSRWVLFWLVALAFLAPLKFGTPVSVQISVLPPMGFFDWIFFSWPNELAVLLACGALIWMVLDPNRIAVRADLLFYLPVAFLVTQLIAMPGTICQQTSVDTLMHFTVCVLLFYAAAWYVRDGAMAAQVFTGFGLATFLILIFAVQQHFGGLEATRQFAEAHGIDRRAVHYKLMGERVFATLVSPNTLAAFLVLVFAPMMAWIWVRGRTWNGRVKWATLVFVGALMIYCLALTGSRGGFVAFSAMVVAALLCFLPSGSRRTGWVVGSLVAIGAIFFLAHEAGLMGLGTGSISSRGDYWRGAVAIARDHPWRGTGVGTFGSIYTSYKTATSEEARQVHNDFLEMWCDSGVLAFVVFGMLWVVALRDGFELARQRHGDAASLAICAALAGWVVHGLVDFDLYVPGVAMPAFILLGMLQGLKGVPEAELVPSTGRPRQVLVTACVVICLLLAWAEGRSLLGWYSYGSAMQLMDRTVTAEPDPVGALEKAQRAIQLDPNNPYYYALAGDLAVTQEQFGQAAAYYRSAIRCDSYRASYHWRLARVLMAGGAGNDQVMAELTRATRLNPTQLKYQHDLQGFEESIRQPSPPLLDSSPTEQHP
jgi:O-antigen ligase